MYIFIVYINNMFSEIFFSDVFFHHEFLKLKRIFEFINRQKLIDTKI